jgi:hypothetical protein
MTDGLWHNNLESAKACACGGSPRVEIDYEIWDQSIKGRLVCDGCGRKGKYSRDGNLMVDEWNEMMKGIAA